MNSTYNTMGNSIHELTLYQLQQKAQQLLQQNTILATQLQLNRSHSMYNHQQPSVSSAPIAKQPTHRSLSDIYHPASQPMQQQQHKSVPTTTPPGLSAVHTPHHQPQSPSVLAQLPQPPCIALQRRSSVKSECSQSVESGRYKTELCRPFEETGHCRYGAKCQFAHGLNELRGLNRHPRYKTEFCRTFHTTGFCSYGQRCNFIHNEDERRPAQQQQTASRPHHMPLTVTSSTGSIGSTSSSPASSIYGGDLSPTPSPSYLSEDPFSARLSPTPSNGSFSEISSNMSFPSPPATPLHSDCDYEATTLSSAIEMGLSLNLLNRLQF